MWALEPSLFILLAQHSAITSSRLASSHPAIHHTILRYSHFIFLGQHSVIPSPGWPPSNQPFIKPSLGRSLFILLSQHSATINFRLASSHLSITPSLGRVSHPIHYCTSGTVVSSIWSSTVSSPAQGWPAPIHLSITLPVP
jgi:hypothetical protein